MRIALAALTFSLTPVCLPAQDEAPIHAEVGEVTDVALGVLSPGEERALTFLLSNSTGEDFQSGNISTTCGCTRPRADVVFIPAGGTEEFDITFRAPDEPMTRISMVWFSPVDAPGDRWGIRLTAEIRAGLMADPPEVRLGSVAVGGSEELTRTVTLTNHTGREIEITSASATPERFRIDPAPEVIPAGGSAAITVRFSPLLQAGPVIGELAVATNSPERPHLRIPLHAEVAGRITVEPDRVWFGFVRLGETRTVTLTLRGAESAFAVTEAALDAPGITATPATAEGGLARVRVDLDTGAAGVGIIDRDLILHTNDPIETVVRVDVLGMVSQ